jgi:serpin B
VISPASIALALGMARAGAAGDTAAEMDAVLHEVASDENANLLNSLDAALAELNGTFEDDNGDRHEVALRIANASFAQHDVAWQPAYLDALASRFGAGLQLVDYIANPEASREAINGWVSDETEERIPDLLAPGSIDVDTRLVLVNAIYLKAPWLAPFQEEATTDDTFTTADGATVEVPMMRATESMRYGTADGWQAVELPYIGDGLAMMFIVPDDLAAIEASLDDDVFGEIVAALQPGTVELSMPRFSIETETTLKPLLSELGMPTAFTDRADFSPMTREVALAISEVVHQANIDVDESGTEAAAATAVIMRATSAPAVDLTLSIDRPFLFALRDTGTGAVLFLGRVTDPSS